MSLAREIYDKTKVGTTQSTMPGSVYLNELKAFQTVVKDFENLQEEGLIRIITKHLKAQSGKHYIDHVQFRRLI